MATQLQIRRGTSAQVAAFTGAEGEVVVNTTNDSVVVHDGSTAGGFEMARVDGSNWAITNNISTTANISFGDNDKAIFGAGSDLEIFHDGSHSYVRDSGTGHLKLQGTDVRIQSADGAENFLVADLDGAVKLYNNDAQKFQTTSTGIDVTGDITLGDANPTITFNDSSVTNLSHAISSASDNLRIMADVNGVDAGSRVEIFDGTTQVARFEAGAVNVTGSVTADGLAVDGTASVSATNPKIQLFETDTTDLNTQIQNQAGDFRVSRLDDDAGSLTVHFSIDHSTGNVSIPSGDLDVTGTVTADGLTVDAGSTSLVGTLKTTANNSSLVYADSSQTLILKNNDANGTARLKFLGTASESGAITFGSGVGATSDTFAVYPRVMTGGKAFNITGGGDISFYEDTGTTPKFFWDASAESLGLGTTSPAFAAGAGLEIEKAGTATLRLQDTTNTANGEIRSGPSGIEFFSGAYGTSGDPFSFSVSGTTALTIDSSRNVGIGTSSPSKPLQITDATNDGTGGVKISSYLPTLEMDDISGGGTSFILQQDGTSTLFKHDATERMRIDASGNLYIGKSVTTYNTEGALFEKGAALELTTDSGRVLRLNRTSTDGNILEFNRGSGSVVGSIGTSPTANFNINSSQSGHVGLEFGSPNIMPMKDGALADNAVDLGVSTQRFRNIYLAGGIQLGGTGSANKLDDYEEGSFTASLRGANTQPGTLVTTTGYYTKIGRTFTYNISFENVDTTGYSGAVSVTGLPMANNFGRHVGAAGVYSLASWTDNVAGIINLGATTIDLMDIRSENGWASTTHNAGSTRYLWLSGTYMTTA